MTSEAQPAPRFPLGLTLAAAIAIAFMVGLGVWQLQRLAWKQNELARIAALRSATPTPIGPVLSRAAKGDDVTFTPVIARCLPAPATSAQLHMTTLDGDWIARALSACRLPGGPYQGILVDRGVLPASRGSATPSPVVLPAPVEVTGVLFTRRRLPAAGLSRPAPYVLVAKSETPAPPGVVPTPYPGAAGANLQYVGSYAPTWFGLAGVALCFYAAMLWRRYHPKA